MADRHSIAYADHSAVDAILGYRSDRRRKYMIIDGVVYQMASYTTPCSGCKCDTEYPCSCCRIAGDGCEECGYTGRRRHDEWMPVTNWKGVQRG